MVKGVMRRLLLKSKAAVTKNVKIGGMNMKKSFMVLLVVVLGTTIFTGCTNNRSTETTKDTQETNNTEQDSGSVSAKFGFITGTGGLGDKNMNDATYEGLKSLESTDVKIDVVEPKDASDFANLQGLFAEEGSYDAIFCIGSDQTDALTKSAKKYPEQKFVLVDSEIEADNVTNVFFRAEETGYQLGVLAGLLEKENALPFLNDEQKIGFVGGMDIPVINQFAAGYEAGAKLVNPDVDVQIAYVGSFADPTTATELATGLYEDGCDIVFACAGGSGLGVFTSAGDNDGYAFGIEMNQNSNAPDNIIASGIRDWTAVMTDVGTKIIAGELSAGTLTYGIKEGTLEVGFEDSNVEVSEVVKEEMNSYFDKVINGEITLPTTLEDVDSFLAEAK